ncbi:MAG: NADP-dependent oxidoreductase [Devosia sp.]|uniref:NADP-dependent oxidoreductase n=1 Tax=Devosia sp. TaxID=1871048 RepID=UPI0033988B59
MNNQAIILTQFGGVDTIKASTTQFPEASPGLVVVRVRAAGINGLDWKIREGYLRDAMPTVFPTVLGLELAGEVHAVGPGSRFAVGDRVFGLAAPGNGAYAEYVAVPEMLLAPMPSKVSNQVAAALPVAGLTAWQMLHAAGAPKAGNTMLVHGAAGGVGTLLVQMAKQMDLNVIATASPSSRQHLLDLGVTTVIDRVTETFEDMVSGVDLVIDLVGADAPDRSWSVLREGGTMVSAARFDIAAPRTDGRHGIAFMMQPDGERLAAIVRAVADGQLNATIEETVPFAAIPAAIERNRTGHGPGKTVADFAL